MVHFPRVDQAFDLALNSSFNTSLIIQVADAVGKEIMPQDVSSKESAPV